MDKFKKYLQENRSRLDKSDFSVDEGWDAIREKLPGQKKKTAFFYWGIAASFIIVVLTGVYTIYQRKPAEESVAIVPPKEKVPNQAAITDINLLKKAEDSIGLIANNRRVSETKKMNPKKTRKSEKPIKQLTEAEEMGMSFQTVINAQLRIVRTTPFYAENPDYFSYFKKEYTILEKEEKTLEMEVKNNGMNEQYLNKLIDIYQEKLSLLKRLQAEIQKMNNRIRQSDPDVNKRKPVYLNI